MAHGPDVACRSRLPAGLNYTRRDKIRDCTTRRDHSGGPSKILGNVSCRTDERRLVNRLCPCASRLIDWTNKRSEEKAPLLSFTQDILLFAEISVREIAFDKFMIEEKQNEEYDVWIWLEYDVRISMIFFKNFHIKYYI